MRQTDRNRSGPPKTHTATQMVDTPSGVSGFKPHKPHASESCLVHGLGAPRSRHPPVKRTRRKPNIGFNSLLDRQYQSACREVVSHLLRVQGLLTHGGSNPLTPTIFPSGNTCPCRLAGQDTSLVRMKLRFKSGWGLQHEIVHSSKCESSRHVAEDKRARFPGIDTQRRPP